MSRIVILALLTAWPLAAQTTTVSGRVEVPQANIAGLRALLSDWLDRTEVDFDFDPQTGAQTAVPRYRGVQHYLNAQFDEIVKRTLMQSCREVEELHARAPGGEDPTLAHCPAWLKQRLEARQSANAAVESELGDTLRPGGETP